MTDSEIPLFINPSFYSRTIANSFYSFLSVVVATANEFYLKIIIAEEPPLSRMICVWQMKTLAEKQKQTKKNNIQEIWYKREQLVRGLIKTRMSLRSEAPLYLSHHF